LASTVIFRGYIQKPVDFQQFQELVQHLGLHWLVVNQTLTSEFTGQVTVSVAQAHFAEWYPLA
jgi:hypothetical protein